MAILKANILTEVQNRTGRGTAISDIDDELLMVMREVSSRIPAACQKSASVTVNASAKSASLPSDFAMPIGLLDPNDNPLTLINFTEYLNYLQADPDAAATVTKYAVNDGNIFVHPKPTAQTVFTMYYSYEEDDTTSIGFDDVFKTCLIEGVCHHIEAGLGVLGGIPEQAITHLSLYEKQITILTARYAHRQT
jgi:hypothetical protein